MAVQIESSLREILASVRSGKRPDEVMRVDIVEIAEPEEYDASAVKATRARLGVSQSVFAKLVGVSPELVQHWEQGVRTPSGLARRLLDRVNAGPAEFLESLVHRRVVGA